MIILTLLVISFFPLIYFQLKRSKKILTPLSIYISFSFLYSFFTVYYVYIDVKVVNINLELLNHTMANYMAYFVILTNFLIYFIFCLIPKKNVYLMFNGKIDIFPSFSLFFLYILLLLFLPLTLIFVYYFPWPKFGAEITFYHSISAYLKIFLVLLFCSLALHRRLGNVSIVVFYFVFFFILLINIIDTARTHMFILLFIFIYSSNITYKKFSKNIIWFFGFIFLFVYVTLSRTGINFDVDLIMWPFFSESVFGSYGALQVISILDAGFWSILSPLFFLTDLIHGFSPLIGNSLGFEYHIFTITNIANSNNIFDGKLYPLGGHFFVSEFLIYFYFLGPFVYALFFCFYSYIMSKFSPELYVFAFSSCFFLVKSPVHVLIKTLILVWVLYILLLFFYKILPKKIN